MADSFSHPTGRHPLLDLLGQCALHTAQHPILVLLGSDYQWDTTTLCGRDWRDDISALLAFTLYVAYPKVFHNALHTGSNSYKDFGLHTFPKCVIQQLETAQNASWKASFRPPPPVQIGTTPLGPLPINLSIRFGAHRASIYGITKAAKINALTATAKAQTRESHAIELSG